MGRRAPAPTLALAASALSLTASAIAPTPALGQPEASIHVGFALGSPHAPLTVVEFGDFACSACATFARTTWSAVRTRYVETGRVRWHMVPFELGFRNSEEGARAAHCAADQGVFWTMHDLLFLRRDEWVGRKDPRDALVALAGRAGADPVRFADCYEDGRTADRMKAANRAARDRGVRGTPTFFIDGVPVQGALPEDVFVALLDEALRQVGGRPSHPEGHPFAKAPTQGPRMRADGNVHGRWWVDRPIDP